MDNKYNYVWEKFFAAVHILVSGGELKTRLTYAHEQLRRLKSENLPKESQNEFKALMDQFVTAEEWGPLGRVDATLSSLDEDQLVHLAKKIHSLYDDIARHMSPFYEGN